MRGEGMATMGSVDAQRRERERLEALRAREHDLLDKATHATTKAEAVKYAEELADTQLGEISTRKATATVGRVLKYTLGATAIGLGVVSGVGAAVLPAIGAVVFGAMQSDQKRLLNEEKAEAVKNKTALLESFRDHGFGDAIPSKKMEKFLSVEVEAEAQKPSRLDSFIHHVNDMFGPKQDTQKVKPVIAFADQMRR